MKFRRYDNMLTFKSDVLDILLEHEVQNNLLLSLISGSSIHRSADWLLASVSGGGGGVALTALFIKPFSLLLFETGNNAEPGAAELLAREMRRMGRLPSGVMANRDLARRFADVFIGAGKGRLHMKTSAMRLDKLSDHKKAQGFCRELEKRDMYYAPFWERSFSEDCRSHVFTIPEYTDRLSGRLGKGTHFIWEDGVPVSQAVHGRDTPNGAVINMVYTPPQYRGHGYAASVVSTLSETLLHSGKKFCCLFADLDNPVSCGIYRKLGYYDVCELEEIRFDIKP